MIDFLDFWFFEEGVNFEVTVLRLLTIPACALNERSGIDFLTPLLLLLVPLDILSESELSAGYLIYMPTDGVLVSFFWEAELLSSVVVLVRRRSLGVADSVLIEFRLAPAYFV